MQITSRVVTLTFLTGLLAACGGGGGSDDGNSFGGGGSGSDSVTLTSENAETVTAAVVNTAFGTDDFSSGIGLIGVVQTTDNVEYGVEEVVGEIFGGFQKLYYSGTADLLSGVVIPPETTACLNENGTMTVSGEVTDPTMAEITSGDFIRIEFSNCDLGEGVTLNGVVTGTFGELSGDFNNEIPPYSLSMSVEMDQFSITSVGETVVADGDFSLSLSISETQTSTQVLEGQFLQFTYDGQIIALEDFNISQEIDLTSGAYTRDISGVLNSDAIGGSVEFTTVQTFEGSGIGNPEAGELLITGANNSTVRVIVIDAVNLALEVDSDGNSTVDNTINTTWDELLSL